MRTLFRTLFEVLVHFSLTLLSSTAESGAQANEMPLSKLLFRHVVFFSKIALLCQWGVGYVFAIAHDGDGAASNKATFSGVLQWEMRSGKSSKQRKTKSCAR